MRQLLVAILALVFVDVAAGQSYQEIVRQYPNAYRAFTLGPTRTFEHPDTNSAPQDSIPVVRGVLVFEEQNDMLAIAIHSKGAVGWVPAEMLRVPPEVEASLGRQQPRSGGPVPPQSTQPRYANRVVVATTDSPEVAFRRILQVLVRNGFSLALSLIHI